MKHEVVILPTIALFLSVLVIAFFNDPNERSAVPVITFIYDDGEVSTYRGNSIPLSECYHLKQSADHYNRIAIIEHFERNIFKIENMPIGVTIECETVEQ